MSKYAHMLRNRSRIMIGIGVALGTLVYMVCPYVFPEIFGQQTKPISGIENGRITNFSTEVAYLASRIGVVGPEEVRDEVLQLGATLNVSESHVLAHAFGDALYKTKGFSSFDVCDESFSYGCMHQFIGTAIVADGVSIVQKLAQACIEKWGETGIGCAHAIGHGIQAYLGYSQDALEQGLPLCDSFTGVHARERCLSGMFMEYDLRGMLASDEFAHVRPFSAEKPYAPCDTFSGQYRQACFHELPLGWMNSTGWGTTEKIFENTGRLCADAQRYGSDAVRNCYMGMGIAVAILEDYDIDSIKNACTTYTRSGRERLLCLSEALYKFRIASVPEYLEYCDRFGFTEDFVLQCRAQASR